MVIYKKNFPRHATCRGRMDFETKYSNCGHSFGRTRPVAKNFPRRATCRGRMDFETKYSNCGHSFGRTRPV